MALVYRFGAWRELIPDSCNPARKVKCVTTSEYEPKVISPEEAHSVWSRLAQPENTLVLLVAVTDLRISEALGLKWSDIDPKAELIHVRRSWTMDREGKPKSRASRAAVACVEMLAKHLEECRLESQYAGDDDWVFPSVRNKGKTPRSGSILVTDYLKKAAYEAGVLKPGENVQFGMQNLRHSLATYLIAVGFEGLGRFEAANNRLQDSARIRPLLRSLRSSREGWDTRSRPGSGAGNRLGMRTGQLWIQSTVPPK
jgi:integrase